MSVFGWSLPPGCGTLPGEQDEGPCEICGFNIELCICHECKVCGEVGDPNCYEFSESGHWQKKTQLQQVSLDLHEQLWKSWNENGAKSEKILDAQQILYQVSPYEEVIRQLKELFNVKD